MGFWGFEFPFLLCLLYFLLPSINRESLHNERKIAANEEPHEARLKSFSLIPIWFLGWFRMGDRVYKVQSTLRNRFPIWHYCKTIGPLSVPPLRASLTTRIA